MKKIKFISEILIFVFLDQLTKYIVYLNKANLPINIINKLFDITYCENKGIAFGILNGKVPMICCITIILIIVVVLIIKTNFYKVKKSILLGSALVISGGMGNFIDRIIRGYVIDFIDFSYIFNFPVFNFADICIVLGVIIIGISYFILDRGEVIENNCSR